MCAWRSLHGLLASGNTSSTAKWAAKPSFRCDKNDRKLHGAGFKSSEKVMKLYVNMLTTYKYLYCMLKHGMSIIGPSKTVIVSFCCKFYLCQTWVLPTLIVDTGLTSCGATPFNILCQRSVERSSWTVRGARNAGLESTGSWWFQILFIFTPIWGGDSHFDYIIFFKRVETTT